MIRRPPRSTQSRSSAASDVYKRQVLPQFSTVSVRGGYPSDMPSQLSTPCRLLERIDEATAARCLPPVDSTADQCLHFYAVTEEGKRASVRLQKTLSIAAAEKVSATKLEASVPVEAARFFACTAPYASAWLSDPFLARPMTDEAHGAACKLRLNQPKPT